MQDKHSAERAPSPGPKKDGEYHPLSHLPSKVAAVITAVALEHGVPPERIIQKAAGKGQDRYGHARYHAMARLYAMPWGIRPHPSQAQIAAWIGVCDYSYVRYGLRRWAEIEAARERAA